MICPSSFSPLDWIRNSFNNMPSSQIAKIAMVAALVFIGIALIFIILGITGALGAMFVHPLIAVAILAVVLVVILIAGVSMGAYAHFHPRAQPVPIAPPSPLQCAPSVDPPPANFDELIDHIFAGKQAKASPSDITYPLELFDSKDPMDPLLYGYTAQRHRWISLNAKHADHLIAIETSTGSQWVGYSVVNTQEAHQMTEENKEFIFATIRNNCEACAVS